VKTIQWEQKIIRAIDRFDREVLGCYRKFIMNIGPNFTRLRVPVCFLAILLTHPTIPSFSAETTGHNPLISLKAKDESLKGVLEKIAKHTGYRIYLNEEWGKIPISIELHNESLRGSINRLLRGLNYAITWDEKKKTISLFICHPGKCSGTMWDVSLSGQRTRFMQPTSTIVE
jgi:hypothetical protein